MIDYPRSFEEIADWSGTANVSVSEGRSRLAQYGVLRAIADSTELSALLVFKGGNALDFVWQPNRSTKDLDFSATSRGITESHLKSVLGQSLNGVGRKLGIKFAVQKVKRQPKGDDKDFFAYNVTVGYALQDEDGLLQRMEEGRPSSQVIPMDISFNEPICAFKSINIYGVNSLQVSTLEDIVAEKLRALLQQPIRNRTRKQDLLDIAVVLLEKKEELDLKQVAAYLLEKANARAVVVSKAAFRDPAVKERAAVEYETLEETTRTRFVPFVQAFDLLLEFVDTLPDLSTV